MTIALNILLAVVAFAGVVGLLASSIVASRTPRPAELHPETAQRPATAKRPATDTIPAPTRRRAYGSLDRARA